MFVKMKKLLPFLLLPLVLCLLSLHNPFFWDAVYYSKTANHFLESHFSSLILPAQDDAGHPPFFALYLAICWKLFGRSLVVSHLAILPFAIGIFWQLARLIMHYFKVNYHELCLMLLAFEPSLMAQSTMVSNDIIIVFFYLLGLNSILKGGRALMFISLTGMACMSIRGMIACPALFLTMWILAYQNGDSLKIIVKKWFLPCFFAFALIACWLEYHYSKTGWFFISPAPNWGGERQSLGPAGMLRNALIIFWRVIDSGRLGWWIVFLSCLPLLIRKKLYSDKNFRELSLIAAISLIVFSLAFIPFSNPIGHRYFIIFYLLAGLLICYVIFNILSGIKKNIAIAFIMLMQLSGHFWIYPEGVAKGWDSTLAHIPYFSLENAMNKYIIANRIPYSSIGTSFPGAYGRKYTRLEQQDDSAFVNKSLTKTPYILQSNIMNGFSNDELKELHSKWDLVQKYSRWPVYVSLYHKRN
jgi:hypothetical protein